MSNRNESRLSNPNFLVIELEGGNNNGNNNRNRNFDPKEDAVVRNVQQFWEETDGTDTKQSNVIVFTNTKDGAEQYGKALTKLGDRFRSKNRKSSASGTVRVIHGDK